MERTTKEEKRKKLKELGWRRADRDGMELWIRPGLTHYGYQHLGISLKSAWTAVSNLYQIERG